MHVGRVRDLPPNRPGLEMKLTIMLLYTKCKSRKRAMLPLLRTDSIPM